MGDDRWSHVRVTRETSERLGRVADAEGTSKAALVERMTREREERAREEREEKEERRDG